MIKDKMTFYDNLSREWKLRKQVNESFLENVYIYIYIYIDVKKILENNIGRYI